MFLGTTLKNLTALITRPKHQADALIVEIENHGGHCILLPTLEIIAIPKNPESTTILKHLDQIQFMIFNSANAVNFGVPMIREVWPTLPSFQVIAQGPATQQALKSLNFPIDLLPEAPYNSESILELAALKTPSTILLVRGRGGRPFLAEHLTQQNHRVFQLEVYQREKPKQEIREELLDKISIIISTSLESLENLIDMVPKKSQTRLRQTPLLVVSTAMAQHAHEFGFAKSVVLSENATVTAITEALTRWWQHKEMT